MASASDSWKSLEDVHASVETANKRGFWRTLLAFGGPAYLVSVGYMDPGNWATDIAAGSKFGYALLWVLLGSNLAALLLQSLSARLGLVRGRDLAQSSREHYPKAVNLALYVLAEIAIIACDLAEVLGMSIGLNLLFGLPLWLCVVITLLDTFLILILQNRGMRKMEAFIIAMIAIIGVAFLIQLIIAEPSLSGIARGFALPNIPNIDALYIAIGIIGATVMPHNLYLHSALVQTRKVGNDEASIRKAIKFNVIDSAIALNLALFVNAAILILAAAVFFKNGVFEVAGIEDAHKLLAPILGTTLAPILFAVALIAAGQSSTITGTLAGQIVMEGYLHWRIQPWLRRLITRLLAVLPAFFATLFFGESGVNQLLILSQVVLSLQLGFAMIPLIHFTSDREKMGVFASPLWMKISGWIVTAVIVGLNGKLVFEEISTFSAGEHSAWLEFLIRGIAVCAAGLLAYITVEPFVRKRKGSVILPHGELQPIGALVKPQYQRIAVPLDFSDSDKKTLVHAIAQCGETTEYLLIHIVETAGARAIGEEILDFETKSDAEYLEAYLRQLRELGYNVSGRLGFGYAKKAIPEIVKEWRADLLVMGSHGHRGVSDIVLGETLGAVRHEVNIPVLIV